jgi:pteridine reductase
MELRGKVALVTGAGRRVGRVLALALAKQGATVAVHFNQSERGARDVVAEIEQGGGTARAFGANLTDAARAVGLPAQVVQSLGALDVLVNSAASMMRTPFGEIRAEAFDEIMALNLRAPLLLSQAAAPHLKQAKGCIVNVADLAAFETWPAYVPHGLSKSGVVHLTKSLARLLAPDVRVNAIAPGTVLLPDDWSAKAAEHLNATTPLKREGRPDDVADAMLYLLRADYVTGETVIVDGGRHVRK